MKNLREYLQIKEAAAYVGGTPATLRNWGNSGKILEQRHPLNNYRLYKKAELDKVLRMAEQPRSKRKA